MTFLKSNLLKFPKPPSAAWGEASLSLVQAGPTFPEILGQTALGPSRIWIVDDQVTSRMVLERLCYLLPEEISVRTFAGPREALEIAKMDPPDLVLADLRMKGMDGLEFTRSFLGTKDCGEIPVAILTVCDDPLARSRAYEAGASDFMLKPIDHSEFLARSRTLLTLRRQRKILLQQTDWLRQCVSDATREIKDREYDTLLHLARAGEYRDEDTGDHIFRMSHSCRIIAQQLGLSTDEVRLLERSAAMHDIGKIGISDTILLKKGRLDPEEHNQLKAHTTIGYNILKGSLSKYLQTGAIIALGHHERYDGGGYPGGLAGEEIPLFSRIVAIADVFDALTSKRPYKKAWPTEEAVAYMRDESGKHFDPVCLEAFLSAIDEVIQSQLDFGSVAEKGDGAP